MWEIDIIINYKYRKFLMYLKENITKSSNYNKKGVFAIIKQKNTAVLSIAIMEPNNKLKSEIKVWIAECLIFSEKESFILQQKILPNNEYKNAFLKALIMVDMKTDSELVAKEVNLDESTINLNSLYRFRLQNLTEKWKKSLMQFFPNGKVSSESQLMEILKSIISNNKKNINVILKKINSYFVVESKTSDVYITSNDEADIIANLILLSPQTIDIECKQYLNNESILIIQFLFGNAINSIY